MHHYWYADLALASAFALPELREASHSPHPDLSLSTGPALSFPAGQTDWRHDWPDSHGRVTLSGARCADRYFLRVPRAADAAFVPVTGAVEASPLPGAPPETFRHALLDQILPRVLAQRGRLVLHGSMVTTPEGYTCVMLGESGMGKSTLAGAFACQGAVVHTDDCFVVQADHGHGSAIATYPGLRLWPDSLWSLFPERVAEAEPMAHYCDKQRLAASAPAERPAPKRLDAILLLQRPRQAQDRAIHVDCVPQREAVMAMLANSFQMDVGDTRHVAKLFMQASRAAALVPAFTLTYPRDYALLPEVISVARKQLGSTHARTPPR